MSRPDALVVLQARIEARAQCWRLGGYDSLAEMMAPLYASAQKTGLFDKLGGVEGIDDMLLRALEKQKPDE